MVEAVAAIKEVVVESAKEAAKEVGRKSASEVSSKGLEKTSANLEKEALDKGNKIDSSKVNLDSSVEKVELRKEGGSYGELKRLYGNNEPPKEIHHMPSDSVNGLETKDGPCIAMDSADHHQTASYGSSREAKQYRAAQGDLIKDGKFQEAVQMDIDDIRGKFGNKYEHGISEMLDYIKNIGNANV